MNIRNKNKNYFCERFYAWVAICSLDSLWISKVLRQLIKETKKLLVSWYSEQKQRWLRNGVTYAKLTAIIIPRIVLPWFAMNAMKKVIAKNIVLTSRCLKITEKVSFNIASEASYVYIVSGQKLIKNAKNGPFWRVFENLKLAVKQSYQTGPFQ